MAFSISTSRRRQLRKLVGESLETRDLMAADMVHHNFMMPEDSDLSGSVTPLDALVVINRLNSDLADEPMGFPTAVDVDADGMLSPLDALTVINFINQRVGTDELPISQVNVRDRIERLDEAMDADLLPPNIDLAIARQIREILAAGGFPEIGDRMVNGVLNRQSVTPPVPGTNGFSEVGVDVVERDPSLDESSISDMNDILDSLDQFDFDFDFSGIGGRSGVNDPTNDNGNGSFLDAESAAPISSFIEIELRKQLKVSDSATIRVAVFDNAGASTSGTWFYLTSEGIGISGNWIYETGKPETLNLFRSNVEIEKRIYVQYPGSGFIYYSWLPDTPVGYYFSPHGNASDFETYFEGVPGAIKNSIGGFTTFSGELGIFDGIAPIEQQASDLYAIDLAGSVN